MRGKTPKNKFRIIMCHNQSLTTSNNSEMSIDMQQIICVLSQLNVAITKDENNEFVYEYKLTKVA